MLALALHGVAKGRKISIADMREGEAEDLGEVRANRGRRKLDLARAICERREKDQTETKEHREKTRAAGVRM